MNDSFLSLGMIKLIIRIQAPKKTFTWVFPKIGVPQNGWFIMENLIKMDDLGEPLFLSYFWFHPLGFKASPKHHTNWKKMIRLFQSSRSPNKPNLHQKKTQGEPAGEKNSEVFGIPTAWRTSKHFHHEISESWESWELRYAGKGPAFPNPHEIPEFPQPRTWCDGGEAGGDVIWLPTVAYHRMKLFLVILGRLYVWQLLKAKILLGSIIHLNGCCSFPYSPPPIK